MRVISPQMPLLAGSIAVSVAVRFSSSAIPERVIVRFQVVGVDTECEAVPNPWRERNQRAYASSFAGVIPLVRFFGTHEKN